MKDTSLFIKREVFSRLDSLHRKEKNAIILTKVKEGQKEAPGWT